MVVPPLQALGIQSLLKPQIALRLPSQPASFQLLSARTCEQSSPTVDVPSQ
jgi:hypothetical protein